MTNKELKLILLAGFDDNGGSCAQVIEHVSLGCHKLLLPDDREKAVKLINSRLDRNDIRVIVLLGQKPRIKDKIAVEPTIIIKTDCGMETLRTPIDCYSTARALREGGISAYISRGCGTSTCAEVYAEYLKSRVNCVMLSVPTADNITDAGKLAAAIDVLLRQFDRIPCLL